MKKTLKKLLTLGLSAAISTSVAFGLVGCNKEKEPIEDKNQSTVQPEEPPVVDPNQPSKPPVDSGSTDKTEKLNNAVANLKNKFNEIADGKNFTYTEQTVLKKIIEVDNSKVKVQDKGTTVFYESTADGKTFSYTPNGNGWDKEISDFSITDMINSAKNIVDSVNWTELEANGHLLGNGTIDNVKFNVDLHMSGNNAQVKVKDTLLGTTVREISLDHVGSTTVTIPNEKINDQTVEQSDLLYTEVNGERIWNVKLIADTIENWMPENYYSSLGCRNLSLKKIIGVRYKDNFIYLDAIMGNGESMCYQPFVINPRYAPQEYRDDIAKYLETGKGLSQYLNRGDFPYPISIKGSPITLDYATGIDATEDEEKEFAILSQNIVDRLYKIGTQPYGAEHDKDVKKYNELVGGKVIFGCVGPLQTMPAGLDIGNYKAFEVVLIVNVDNEYKLLKADVCSSTDRVENGKTNVLKDSTNKNWVIPKCEIQDINKENAVLYKDDFHKNETKSL